MTVVFDRSPGGEPHHGGPQRGLELPARLRVRGNGVEQGRRRRFAVGGEQLAPSLR